MVNLLTWQQKKPVNMVAENHKCKEMYKFCIETLRTHYRPDSQLYSRLLSLYFCLKNDKLWLRFLNMSDLRIYAEETRTKISRCVVKQEWYFQMDGHFKPAESSFKMMKKSMKKGVKTMLTFLLAALLIRQII